MKSPVSSKTNWFFLFGLHCSVCSCPDAGKDESGLEYWLCGNFVTSSSSFRMFGILKRFLQLVSLISQSLPEQVQFGGRGVCVWVGGFGFLSKVKASWLLWTVLARRAALTCWNAFIAHLQLPNSFWEILHVFTLLTWTPCCPSIPDVLAEFPVQIL